MELPLQTWKRFTRSRICRSGSLKHTQMITRGHCIAGRPETAAVCALQVPTGRRDPFLHDVNLATNGSRGRRHSRRQPPVARVRGARVVGATPRDLVVEVLRGRAGRLLPGLSAGTLLAAGAATLLRVTSLGVNVLNPLTYVAVAIVECAIVMAASTAPALRAARVDPLVALREM